MGRARPPPDGRSLTPENRADRLLELLLPLFSWPKQRNHEELRPVTLLGACVAERARETGARRRTAGSCAPWATRSRRYGMPSAPVGRRSEYRNSASATAAKNIQLGCHIRFV